MNYYTTSIAASKSMANVEQLLVKLGVTETHKIYKDGRIAAMHFAMNINGSRAQFKMPLRINEVYEKIKNFKRLPASKRTIEHAERIVWKNLNEWLKTMSVLVEIGMCSVLDCILPHLITKLQGNNEVTLSNAILHMPSDSFEKGINLLPRGN